MNQQHEITSNEPVTPALDSSITYIRVYATDLKLYIIGSQPNNIYRVMTLDRLSLSADNEEEEDMDDNGVYNNDTDYRRSTVPLQCYADKRVYNQQEIDVYLSQLQSTFSTIKLITTAFGLLGFVRFTAGYYCHFVTKVAEATAGTIGGHPIYVVKETKLLSVTSTPKVSSKEQRMKAAYEGCDLGGSDCFFSYTYDLTHTLQQNVKARHHARLVGTTAVTSNNRFIWNAQAMRELILCVGVPSCWILPLIHGYFEQKHVKTSTGRNLSMTLIARRSRYFAGTRFNRRGADILGNVANEVETEQLLCDVDSGMSTSLVQVRGSIPLHWSHFNLRSPKPGFKIYKSDRTFSAAKKHFENLEERYGQHIASINLIRQHEDVPKELILLEEYGKCIPYLNNERKRMLLEVNKHKGETSNHSTVRKTPNKHQPIKYEAYDFNMNAKDPDVDVLRVVTGLMSELSEGVGFFSSHRQSSKTWFAMCQKGVVRTNCIDCLDRTNATQFCLGKLMLPKQLEALGIDVHPSSANELWPHLMLMWARHGNEMGMQYAGSGAMHSLALDRGSGGSSSNILDVANSGQEGINGMNGRRSSGMSNSSSSSARSSATANSNGRLFDDQHRNSNVSSISGRISTASSIASSFDGISGRRSLEEKSNSLQHKKQLPETQKIVLTKGVKNAMVAVTRYISNNWSDDQRQKNMDQFLGLGFNGFKNVEVDQELLNKEMMYRASLSRVPNLLCMQILRKSQNRTFEERHAASQLTSFNEKIAHGSRGSSSATSIGTVDSDGNNNGLSSNRNLKKTSTPELLPNSSENVELGNLLNPIIIQADECCSAGLLSSQASKQAHLHNTSIIPQLSFNGMWRVAAKYDECYHHGKNVIGELTEKFYQDDQKSLKEYKNYCAVNNTKTLLHHFVFDRGIANDLELYESGVVMNTTNGDEIYRYSENENDESESDSDSDNENEESKEENILSPKKLREQAIEYKVHVGTSDGIDVSPTPPLLYQDGEFTRLSNRRDSWVMNQKGGSMKVMKKKKRTLFSRFTRTNKN